MKYEELNEVEALVDSTVTREKSLAEYSVARSTGHAKNAFCASFFFVMTVQVRSVSPTFEMYEKKK